MVELIDLIDDGMINLWKKDLELYNKGQVDLDEKYVIQLEKVCKLIYDYRKENNV